MIRPMRLADLESAVRIHLSSFPGFFLSCMGPRFLREFYRTALLDDSGITFVWGQEHEIDGFIAGTMEPRGYYGRTILNYWYRFLVASTIPLLEKPQTLVRLARRFLMTTQSNYATNEALVMSIAVDPLKQG